MTFTRAIREAKAALDLCRSTWPGQWQVDQYDDSCDVWRQGYSTDYWRARADYATAVVDDACDRLGISPAFDPEQGTIEQRVARCLRVQRRGRL